MNSDPQDKSESLDDDKLGDEYPPEEPLGVDQYGITRAEERVDEPIEERVTREEPDVLVPEPEPISLVAEPVPDTEQQLIASEPVPDPRDDGFFEVDPPERLGDAEVPAEVQAVHEIP